ncbi:hypothetical protein V0U79_12780 [Hyphobacterium sp. HN65]|uniref:Uncharacterized protein n=1 Tax=Hyphobacterium lacteum TaxID=3116575 RepID=A0ABU7LTI4_9PROT|nr:hypothetical protein [Hyphobacterium sp. HN65]MEE2527240.1 hypothetical protein [Hyphobacterium sp. HN65]
MKPWRLVLWLMPFALLAIPAIVMQFTAEVAWGPEDFLVMGFLLLALTALIDVIVSRLAGRRARLIGIAIVLVVFLLVWAELAVGILH